MSRMNPLNLCEPLSAKVHRQKPHDVRGMTGESEPYEPFLDMVWGVTERVITSLNRRFPLRPSSCSKKVHRVHRPDRSARIPAVFGNEPLSRDVHAGFIGFIPMKGERGDSHQRSIRPVAVTTHAGFSPGERVWTHQYDGTNPRQPPTPSHSYTMIAELIESLFDRTDDDETDMSLMTRGDDDSIDWENTPFEPTAKLKSKGGPIEEYAERGAGRLYEELTATKDGQLADVRTSWIDVGAGVGYDSEGLYFFEVGPTVATAPGVTWNAAFTMDLDDAPAFKSDEWKDMAREFQLSEHEAEHGTESMIMCAYSALEELTERNDGDRAVHPRELRQHGPAVTDRYFELAMTCLAEFDGVDGPTEGPAWSYADPERVDTEAGDTEETPA